ncbi:hypothetical protein KCU81_g6679, partial [Aureobasidium melanogenum]|uniref:Uncharacterized protein n=1 Tax=Aureobasidium melanogenum (strain CBS 110374) TaxID=1043003 RepID=A0A074VGH0_AURM1
MTAAATNMKNIRWEDRTNRIVILFNNEQFALARKEVRVLLDYPELHPLCRIRCLIVLARAVEDRYQAQMIYNDANRIWAFIRRRWPPRNTYRRGNCLMAEARRKLDDLRSDILADEPNDDGYFDGPPKWRPEPAKEERERSTESVRVHPFKKNAEMTDQKKGNSLSEVDDESFLDKLKRLRAETYAPISEYKLDQGFCVDPRVFFSINMECISVEKSMMVCDIIEEQNRFFPFWHTPGQAEKKKAAIPGSSVSNPRQVQDRNIALPGRSILPIIEKEDTKIDKPKTILRDVPDELSSDEDAAGGKVEKLTMTEIFHWDQYEESSESKLPSPTKVKPSASPKPSRSRPASSDHSASAPQQANDVSAQAEDSRSSSTSVLGLNQVELPHSLSAPLPETSKNVEPSHEIPQSTKKNRRSSVKGVFKLSVNNLKNLKTATIGEVITRDRRRLPTAKSSLEAVLKADDKRRAAAERDKKNKTQKKSSGQLASDANTSERSGRRLSIKCSMSCLLSCSW